MHSSTWIQGAAIDRARAGRLLPLSREILDHLSGRSTLPRLGLFPIRSQYLLRPDLLRLSQPSPNWPVDVTVEQILARLARLCLRSHGIARLPFVWFWPDGASSCAIVTHDVETAAGRDRCSWLMDVDDSHGIKASFQIVPEQRYSVSLALLDEIRNRGFEINIHDLNHDGHLFS